MKHNCIRRLGSDDNLLKYIINKAKQNPKRVVFAEAENIKILKAAQIAKDEGIAIPILLGNEAKICAMIEENNLHLAGVEIIDPKSDDTEKKRYEYGEDFLKNASAGDTTFTKSKKVMRTALTLAV